MIKVNIIVNDIKFRATLEENSTVDAFIKLLPLRLEMNKYRDKEVYYYLRKVLPTNNISRDTLDNGTLYLSKDNCLTLVYETYSTNEEYTPLGKIDDPTDLKSAFSNNEREVIIELIKKI